MMNADYAALVDDVTVTHGYETALGAALGDDLEASSDMNAPAVWAKLGRRSLDAKSAQWGRKPGRLCCRFAAFDPRFVAGRFGRAMKAQNCKARFCRVKTGIAGR